MPTVLIAPDKFKGSLTAMEVCRALATGIRRVHPVPAPEDGTGRVAGPARAGSVPSAATHLDLLPIADGGDGTIEAALAAGFVEHRTEVTGPTGEPVSARWAQRGTEAVLELAEASGLRLLPGGRLDHARAQTVGLGQVLLAARDAGAREITVGIGGSASTDGGTGMLRALGARLTGADGQAIPVGHDGLDRLEQADLAPALAAVEGLTIVAACDVTSPLLGPEGAAAVFGPQKGLEPSDVSVADARLRRLADLVDPEGAHRDLPGAGAAGGTGFALSLLGARFTSGADAVLDLLDLDGHVARADLVITGEGHLDAQTLQGKGPAEVARRARAAGRPVIAVAGAVSLDASALEHAGIAVALDLVSRAGGTQEAIARARTLLEDVGEQIGRENLTGQGPTLP
jgi:glycerate kinase